MKPAPSLTNRVFAAALVLALLAELVCVAFMSWVLVDTLSREKQRELATELAIVEQSLDGRRATAEALEQLAPPELRVTWIAADGAVLYDSGAQGLIATENHANRPEVAQALLQGEAQAQRVSNTLGEVTYYRALRLADGTVLRLSATQNQLFAVLTSIIVPGIIILLLLMAAAALSARLLSKKLVAPLLALDLGEPLQNSVYNEVAPLLERMDKQNKAIEAQAHEAEQTRRAFTANISHELKTPLTVISGYAELLKAGGVASQEVPRMAGLIFDEAGHMRELVEDVLVLAQLDEASQASEGALQAEEVDLSALAANVVDRLAPFAEQHAVTVRLVTRGNLRTFGYPRILKSMIYNLCENAIRYNRPDGSVLVELGEPGELGAPGTDSSQYGDQLSLRITDTGIGIKQEDLSRVFERFYRVDETRSRATGGTGLGLAIVKHGAQLHGASLSLTSEPGAGTTVTLIFTRGAE